MDINATVNLDEYSFADAVNKVLAENTDLLTDDNARHLFHDMLAEEAVLDDGDVQRIVGDVLDERNLDTNEIDRMIEDAIDNRNFADADDVLDDEAVRDIVRQETPDTDDFVTVNGIYDYAFMTESELFSQLQSQLDSLPHEADRRCSLGQAFTRAVNIVLQDFTEEHLPAMVQAEVRDAFRRAADSTLDRPWHVTWMDPAGNTHVHGPFESRDVAAQYIEDDDFYVSDKAAMHVVQAYTPPPPE